MLVYDPGVSGSGKSAVCAELLARGYAATDSDFGTSGWFRREDGVEVPTLPGDDFRAPEWSRLHQWRFSVERAAVLAKKVEGKLGSCVATPPAMPRYGSCSSVSSSWRLTRRRCGSA